MSSGCVSRATEDGDEENRRTRGEEQCALNFHTSSSLAHSKFLQQHSTDTLDLINSNYTIHIVSASERQQRENDHEDTLLNMRRIFDKLDTRWLGHVMIHTPRISSTQDVFKSVLSSWPSPSIHGYVSLADTQTSGRGRRGTKWISPQGSVSMTVSLSINLNHDHQAHEHTQSITSYLIFVQYITAISLCESCTDNDKKKDLRIKWPNDIYYKNVKIAGILCEAKLNHSNMNQFNIFIGIGMNVLNDYPTICLYPTTVPNSNCVKEEFIAKFLNRFEKSFHAFIENGFEVSGLRQTYERLWLHHDQHVKIGGVNGPHAIVKGLAPNGWVRVLRSDLNAFQDLPPEETSLDMNDGVLKEKQWEQHDK